MDDMLAHRVPESTCTFLPLGFGYAPPGNDEQLRGSEYVVDSHWVASAIWEAMGTAGERSARMTNGAK
jgi:hypothetical protein